MFYTGKGDKGDTNLFSSKPGERLSKTKPVFEVLGTMDELNSLLGLCRSRSKNFTINLEGKTIPAAGIFHELQEALFIVQAELAGADKHLGESAVKKLEALIRAIEKEIPPIAEFRVTGEVELGAWCDFARALSRRAERALLNYAEKNPEAVSENTRKYLNRLSSVLYALARVITRQSGASEKPPTYA